MAQTCTLLLLPTIRLLLILLRRTLSCTLRVPLTLLQNLPPLLLIPRHHRQQILRHRHVEPKIVRKRLQQND